MQTPFVHVWPGVQLLSQAPQLRTSVLRSEQVPLQSSTVAPPQMVGVGKTSDVVGEAVLVVDAVVLVPL